MSNQNQTPIRVADLSESIYVPRTTANETAKAYLSSPRSRVSKVLDEPESQYVWNKQPAIEECQTLAVDVGGDRSTPVTAMPPFEDTDLPFVRTTERFPIKADRLPQTQPATERYSTARNVVDADPRSELADVRAHFALESEQNVALLKPVTIDELPAESQTDSHAESFEDSVYRPTKIESPATTHVWGLDYHIVDMEQTLDFLEQVIYRRKPSYAVTANLNYAMLCASDHRLLEFTLDSVLTLCDGTPVLWRSKLNAAPLPERVAGADLIFRLAERCAQKKLRVYLYGASEGVAEKAASALKNLYPKLIVAGVQCPPFRDCSSEEIKGQIARIKQSKPDLLLVALGQPKGEFWIEDHLEELGVPLTIQLGASFDFVAGNAIRAPKLVQKLGMEWLFRTLRDPVRLAPRYLKNFVFLFNAVRQELIDKLS